MKRKSKSKCQVLGCKEDYAILGICTKHYIKLLNDIHKRALKSKLCFD